MMPLNNGNLREFFLQPTSLYTRPVIRRIVLGMVFFFLFTFLLSADFISDKVSFTVGQVSDKNIIAPRTISYVNAEKTRKLEEEVLGSIANVYDLDVAVSARAEEAAAGVFAAARAVYDNKTLTTPQQRASQLEGSLPTPLSVAVIEDLLQLNETELARAEEQTKFLLKKYYQRGVREDDLDVARKHAVIEVEELKLGKHMESVVASITQKLLKANFILNIRETDKRKQAALASIDPVRETIKKGQNLVKIGDVITLDQIHAMDELGLYKGQIGETRIFGLTIFILLMMILIVAYLYKFIRNVYDSDRHLLLLGIVIVLSLLLGKAAHYYSDFAAPVAVGALLAAILLNMRVGILTGITVSLFFGVIVEHDLRAVAAALISSLVGVYSVSKLAHGYSLTRTGVWLAAINFLVITSSGFIEQVPHMQVLQQGALGALGGLASAVIAIGVLPYFEHSFSITTTIKLLDLAKPNHPLLQRLLLEAPGTYHHSVLVGNLAETAADSIGADPVTVRVGAYYHDIGKIRRPYFFVENQAGNENPHDKIAPSLSTLIVTSHIRDGLDLCKEYNIPEVITDIVQQHHGTMLVSYFYKRAAETEHSECIAEADFRYEGPRPQTKEAALIMLADACEAAVRSLSKPNLNRIEAMVRKIIRERLHDGQLDDCNLTLKDLKIIGDVFIRVLTGIFHTRIEYPEALKDLERRKNKIGNNTKSNTDKDDSNSGDGADSQSRAEKNV